MEKRELIVAPATPKGRGAIGVVRLSGARVEEVAAALTGRTLEPRVATLCNFLDADGSCIDQGLAIYFPSPRSYTGESMLELQGHGGSVVQTLLVRRCIRLGARLAQPGEFTKRAFLNDRVDLTQAEAVADLIDAHSELAARSAVRSLQGEFSDAVTVLENRLLDLRALVESSMDFPEEGLELVPSEQLRAGAQGVADSLEAILRSARRGRRLREGAKLVLVGAPNVGKSSLLNRLAGDDIAIVSDMPGTTRDVLREPIILDGLPFELVDTAGLRDSTDPLENMGIERTHRALKQADVVVQIRDGKEALLLHDVPEALAHIAVVNKIDLSGEQARVEVVDRTITVYLSAKTGAGLDLLREELVRAVGWTHAEEGAFLARERHLSALNEANECVSRALDQIHSRELFAEDMRLAQVALSAITGAHTADELLGTIFSRFCIGK